MNLAVISLGCDKATVDSERLVGKLVGHGASLVADPDMADVVLVNTCGFIDAAKQESIETMLQAARLKENGTVKAVVAVGCLIERYKDELEREIPEIDLFLKFDELHCLIPALAEKAIIVDPISAHPGVRRFFGDTPHVRYLKISEGCDHSCAFCAIPLMRGAHNSETLLHVVDEAKLLEKQGAKEVCLIAQDLGHYGRDLGHDGPRLPNLLEKLLHETSIPWFRLLYVYPLGLTPRLVDLMAREERIVPYIDIPIQHASDRILERMRRPERRDMIREKVNMLRERVPDIAIRTTAIIGFPGETNEDFRVLRDFLEEVEFDRLGTFTYSPQEGTLAAEYSDDVPEDVKRAREDELSEIQRAITEDRLARYVGRETDVLIDRLAEVDEAPFTHVGRVKWQADDVDGVTYVVGTDRTVVGDFTPAILENNRDYDFDAKALL